MHVSRVAFAIKALQTPVPFLGQLKPKRQGLIILHVQQCEVNNSSGINTG